MLLKSRFPINFNNGQLVNKTRFIKIALAVLVVDGVLLLGGCARKTNEFTQILSSGSNGWMYYAYNGGPPKYKTSVSGDTIRLYGNQNYRTLFFGSEDVEDVDDDVFGPDIKEKTSWHFSSKDSLFILGTKKFKVVRYTSDTVFFTNAQRQPERLVRINYVK